MSDKNDCLCDQTKRPYHICHEKFVFDKLNRLFTGFSSNLEKMCASTRKRCRKRRAYQSFLTYGLFFCKPSRC